TKQRSPGPGWPQRRQTIWFSWLPPFKKREERTKHILVRELREILGSKISVNGAAGAGELRPRGPRHLTQVKKRWSGQLDSNQRPAVPKTAALPGCAIPRRQEYGVDTRSGRGQQGAATASTRASTRSPERIR